MKNKKILVSVLVLFVTAGLFAIGTSNRWFMRNANDMGIGLPDPKEEMKKLFSSYNHPDSSMNIQGTIKLYDSENEKVVKEESMFHFFRKGVQFYSQLGYLQTFYADSLMLQVDTMNKSIYVSKVDQKSSVPLAQTGALPYEQMMSDTASFKIEAVVAEKGKERTLTIKSDFNPEIRSCSVTYDPVTYKIKNAEIEWWKKNLVRDEDITKKTWLTKIEYSYPGANELSVAAMISRIIVLKENKIEPLPAYKEYSVQTSF